MNKMARLKLSLFGLSIILLGLSNPVLLIPCLAIGLYVFERRGKERQRFEQARRIRSDQAYLRQFR